ncbi:MAG: hypothetical protein AAFN93_05270 [Bacteroidota bacterium]
MKNYFVIVLCLYLLPSCIKSSTDELSPAEYESWVIDNSENITRSKNVRGLSIEARYLPSQYMAYQDLERSSQPFDQMEFDKVLSEYQCSLNFQVMLEATSKEDNLLRYNIRSYEEYKRVINDLNFQIPSFIYLTLGEVKYQPVLSHFEGYNEFSNKLVFHIAFNPEEYECGQFKSGFNADKLRLTFDDPHWDTGMNHFTFKREHLEHLPQISLLKL